MVLHTYIDNILPKLIKICRASLTFIQETFIPPTYNWSVFHNHVPTDQMVRDRSDPSGKKGLVARFVMDGFAPMAPFTNMV